MPSVLRFEASLADYEDVERSIEVREDQTLEDLHNGIQTAFGWRDDHLYSFWLDGRFWGDRSTEYTAPIEPDEDVATADVPIVELGLTPGTKLAYVFDFGDSWRVALRLAATTPDDGDHYPRTVATKGGALPRYPLSTMSRRTCPECPDTSQKRRGRDLNTRAKGVGWPRLLPPEAVSQASPRCASMSETRSTVEPPRRHLIGHAAWTSSTRCLVRCGIVAGCYPRRSALLRDVRQAGER